MMIKIKIQNKLEGNYKFLIREWNSKEKNTWTKGHKIIKIIMTRLKNRIYHKFKDKIENK